MAVDYASLLSFYVGFHSIVEFERIIFVVPDSRECVQYLRIHIIHDTGDTMIQEAGNTMSDDGADRKREAFIDAVVQQRAGGQGHEEQLQQQASAAFAQGATHNSNRLQPAGEQGHEEKLQHQDDGAERKRKASDDDVRDNNLPKKRSVVLNSLIETTRDSEATSSGGSSSLSTETGSASIKGGTSDLGSNSISTKSPCVGTTYLMINKVKHDINNILYYNPDEKDPNTGEIGVMTINNKYVEEGNDIHSWTLRTNGKRGGCRPRSYPSSKIIDELNPIVIDNAIFGDVVEVEFNEETKNFVFFASEKSECPLLRKIHQCYAQYRFDIDRLRSSIPQPNKLWKRDNLAGGLYLPCGYAIRGGTRESGPKYPYMIHSGCYSIVKELFSIYAKILGLEARVIQKYFPAEYDENHKVYMDGKANDCIFPSPNDQQGGTNDIVYLYWCLHQVALRIMGGEESKIQRNERRMAWHVDQTDVESNQLLTFLPIGGDYGRGGHVPDSDLMVFEHDTGGKCFRLRTTKANTVVFILMNSGRQLHGSAMERINDGIDNNNYSARFIGYGRENVRSFGKRRIDGKIKGEAYQNTRLLDHIPLSRDAVKVGDTITATWGKKKQLFHAKLITIDCQLHFQWDIDGKTTLCSENSVMYSKKCYNVHPSECKHCNPS